MRKSFRHTNSQFASLVFIAVIISDNCFHVLSSESLNPNDPPVIGAYKKNYAGHTSFTISNRRDSEATLPKLSVEDHIWEGISLQLNCRAGYPVKWVYSGPGSPPVHLETFRHAPELYNPSSYSYSASVTFTHTTERQTGKYTCESIENPSLQSFIYLFVPGRNIFLGNSETNGSVTFTVTPSENDSWVTLPCAVSIKEAQVHLYKSTISGNVKEIELDEGLLYDPKVGYRLKWRGDDVNDPFGKYYCKGHLDDRQEKLHFRLTPPKSKYPLSSSTAGSRSTIENQISNFEDTDPEDTKVSSINFYYDDLKKRIRCCSDDKSTRPKMVHSRCESMSDCDVRKIYVQHKSCFPRCGHMYTAVNNDCVAYELATYSDSGIIECSIRDASKNYYQFSFTDGVFITDFNESPPLEKILKLMKDHTSPNGTATYSCLANSFYFSHGIRWGVRKRNGALEILKEDHSPAKPYKEIDENEYTAVYCFAPIWNSPTEWRNVSISTTA